MAQEANLPMDQDPSCIHGRNRCVDRNDDLLTTQQSIEDEMSMLFDQSEELGCQGRKSEKGRLSERRSEICESYTGRASYKSIPRKSQRSGTVSQITAVGGVSEYGNLPERNLDEAAEAPALVAGIASMMNLRDRADHQKTNGYRSVMDIEYIKPPRRKARDFVPSAPLVPLPPPGQRPSVRRPFPGVSTTRSN